MLAYCRWLLSKKIFYVAADCNLSICNFWKLQPLIAIHRSIARICSTSNFKFGKQNETTNFFLIWFDFSNSTHKNLAIIFELYRLQWKKKTNNYEFFVENTSSLNAKISCRYHSIKVNDQWRRILVLVGDFFSSR